MMLQTFTMHVSPARRCFPQSCPCKVHVLKKGVSARMSAFLYLGRSVQSFTEAWHVQACSVQSAPAAAPSQNTSGDVATNPYYDIPYTSRITAQGNACLLPYVVAVTSCPSALLHCLDPCITKPAHACLLKISIVRHVLCTSLQIAGLGVIDVISIFGL